MMQLKIFVLLCGLSCGSFAKLTAPEQISIAATGMLRIIHCKHAQVTLIERVLSLKYTEHYSSVVVTWVTFDPTTTSEVHYGLSNGDTPNVTLSATGSATKFDEDITRYIHRVTINGLVAQGKYGIMV